MPFSIPHVYPEASFGELATELKIKIFEHLLDSYNSPAEAIQKSSAMLFLSKDLQKNYLAAVRGNAFEGARNALHINFAAHQYRAKTGMDIDPSAIIAGERDFGELISYLNMNMLEEENLIEGPASNNADDFIPGQLSGVIGEANEEVGSYQNNAPTDYIQDDDTLTLLNRNERNLYDDEAFSDELRDNFKKITENMTAIDFSALELKGTEERSLMSALRPVRNMKYIKFTITDLNKHNQIDQKIGQFILNNFQTLSYLHLVIKEIPSNATYNVGRQANSIGSMPLKTLVLDGHINGSTAIIERMPKLIQNLQLTHLKVTENMLWRSEIPYPVQELVRTYLNF